MAESPRAQRIRIAKEMQAEYKRKIQHRFGGEDAAPIPLNKGGGDDDFPSAAGAAETLVSTRKRKQQKTSFS